MDTDPIPGPADPTLQDARRALDRLLEPNWYEADPDHPDHPAGPSPHYERTTLHAVGGIGEVWLAHDRQLNRLIALKTLKANTRNRPALRRRFLLEAHITGQLEHPGIVPVYELVHPEHEPPFYAMRFVRGNTLSQAVADHHSARRSGTEGAVKLTDLLQAFVSVCITLEYAHARGVVHRDLKGSNLILGPYGEVIVLDWGIARVLGRRDEDMEEPPVQLDEELLDGVTLAGRFLGTPGYMAPEQVTGGTDQIDRRTDVYGLGAVLHEILIGQPPAPRTSAEPLSSLRQIAPWVPASLDTVCRKALAYQQKDRYATARELADDVKRWLADEPVRACPEPVREKVRRWMKRHPIATTAVVVLLLASCAGYAWLTRQEANRREFALGQARDRDQRAGELVAQVKAWQAEARTAPPRHARSLAAQALAASQEAVTLLREGGADEELARQVQTLAEQVRQDEHDREMVARLEEAQVRLSTGRAHAAWSLAEADAQYAAVFRWYGIDPATQQHQTVVRLIRSAGIRTNLIAALDFWALVRGQADQARPLRALAQECDADPERSRLRQAIVNKNFQELKRFAGRADLASLPAPTLVLLGLALRNHGPNESMAVLRQAQRLYPDDFQVNEQLARSLLESRPPRVGEAIPFLTALVALRPDAPGVRGLLGDALKQSGRLDEAIWQYERALQMQRDQPAVLTNLGVALYEKGQVEAARRLHEEALVLQPGFPEALNNLGVVLTGKDPDQAIRLFRQVLEIDPGSADTLTNLGHALGEKGQRDQAIACYREALARQPNHAPAHRLLGEALVQNKQAAEGIEHYRQALKSEPEHAATHTNLGAALLARGQPDQATNCFRRALELQPRLAVAHVDLGRILVKKGPSTLKEAIEHFRQALASDPDHADAHTNLGLALSEQRLFDQAIPHLRRACALQPGSAQAHTHLGLALVNKGLVDEGIQEHERALALEPRHAGAHNNLGLALMRKNRVDQAIQHYEKAIALDPNHSDAHNNLGIAWSQKGQIDRALAQFRKAITLDQDHHAARANLGRALLQLDRVDEALEHLRQVIDSGFRNPAAHVHLGVALSRKGQTDQGLEQFRLALQLQPDNAVAHAQVGFTRLEKGQYAQARQALERGSALLPAGDPRRKLLTERIHQAEELEQGEQKLVLVQAGKARPASVAERIVLARVADHPSRGWYVSAACYRGEAVALQPDLARTPGVPHRYLAACAAARASTGEGPEAARLDFEQRAEWRKQALAWLHAELLHWSEILTASGEKEAANVRDTLRRWQVDPALAGVRDPGALLSLPAAEREACGRFWEQVAGVLAHVPAPPKP
jgi:tetratricopeptide (TPR) repeat protein